MVVVLLLLAISSLPCTVRSIQDNDGVFSSNSMLGMTLLQRERNLAVEATEPEWCLDLSLSGPNLLLDYLAYSGKSPNDLGLYEDCRALRNNATLMSYSPPQYSLFSVKFFQLPAKWGMCYPAVCHRTINSTFYEGASRVNFSITGELVDRYEPVREDRWYSVLMLLILCLLIALGLLGTLIENSSIGDCSSSSTHDPLQPPTLRKAGVAKLLVCFSLSYNLPHLLSRQRRASVTDVLDGVRVLSIFWVVWGHCYFFPFLINANNQANVYL